MVFRGPILPSRSIGQSTLWTSISRCVTFTTVTIIALTSFEAGSDAFIAWQLDCPEKGEGMVQAFRRPRCIYGMATLKLHGLEPDAVYETKDIDSSETIEVTGRELMENGLQGDDPKAACGYGCYLSQEIETHHNFV